MRTLTDDLLYAQRSRSPRARVTARIQSRGSYMQPAIAWQPFFKALSTTFPYYISLPDTGSTCIECQNGDLLRVLCSAKRGKVGIQRITTPADPSAWQVTPTDLVTISTTTTQGAYYPGVARDGAKIRIFYGDGANLKMIESTNDGVSWGAAQTLQASGASRIENIYAMVSPSGVWYCAYNGITSKLVLRGVSSSSGSWNSWANHPKGDMNWRVGGMFLGPDGDDVELYLYGTNSVRSELAVEEVEMNGATFVRWLDKFALIDRYGLEAGLHYDGMRGGWLDTSPTFSLFEVADEQYLHLCSLQTAGESRIEEPVLFSDARRWILSVNNYEYLQPFTYKGNHYLVGAGVAFVGAPRAVSASHEVVKYTYRTGQRQGGTAEIVLPAGVDAWPGDMIFLDRSLTQHGRGGTLTLALRAVRVEQWKDRTEITALDGLGLMALMRARRVRVFEANFWTPSEIVRAIIRWAGVRDGEWSASIDSQLGAGVVQAGGTGSTSVKDPDGFIWRGGESALSALARHLTRYEAYYKAVYWSQNGVEHVGVELLDVPFTSSYTYSDETHELIELGWIFDARRPSIMVVVGQRTALVLDGEDWRVRLAKPLYGVRPVPVYYVNRGLIASSNELDVLADGEADRMATTLQVGEFVALANLALEPFDVVTVAGDIFRVLTIAESYERGRLTQRVGLADV